VDLAGNNYNSRALSPSSASRNQRFTLFPALPKELRDQIWEDALPGPRFVEIGWKLWTEELEDGTVVDYCKCISNNDRPAMLHTCHDSREIALKVLRLSFTDDLNYPVYFDISRDTLVFHSFATLCLFLRNSGNPRPFQEGRIPIIALDLAASSMTDLEEIRLSTTAEDFFTSDVAPDFDQE
jgi:hypothetical protein